MNEDIFDKAVKLVNSLPVVDKVYEDFDSENEVGKLSRNSDDIPVTENGYFCVDGDPLGIGEDIELDFEQKGYFYQVSYSEGQTWGSKIKCN